MNALRRVPLSRPMRATLLIVVAALATAAAVYLAFGFNSGHHPARASGDTVAPPLVGSCLSDLADQGKGHDSVVGCSDSRAAYQVRAVFLGTSDTHLCRALSGSTLGALWHTPRPTVVCVSPMHSIATPTSTSTAASSPAVSRDPAPSRSR